MSEEAVKALILEVIQATGATSAKDIGKVMKAVMAKTQGRADGKMVNQLVKEMLERVL